MALWTIRRSILDTPATGLAATTANDKIALPIVRPFGGGTVDVVKHWYWTHSPKPYSREEVPYVRLIEKRLRANALISQLKYSLGQAVGQTAGVLEELANKPDTSNLVKAIAKDVKTLQKTGEALLNKAGIGSNVGDTASQSPFLTPYRNLYLTQDTGWKFFLPYFENSWDGVLNQFSSQGPSNSFGAIAQGASELLTGGLEILATAAKPFSVTYVERAKFFNYSDEGEDITITFPLINTGEATYTDVFNNWQLIYLLLYNNRPGKTSMNTVEQPVLYEVEIPGIKFFPYAYISNISVDFHGARRRMTMNIPYAEEQITVDTTTTGGQEITNQLTGHSIQTIIPDAYMLKITLHGLNTSTRNFMYHMLTRQETVQAGEV